MIIVAVVHGRRFYGTRQLVETFVDDLPSSEASGLASGVADIAFVGDTMYAILAGAGFSHGVASPNAVLRVNPDRSTTMIANLSAFQQANPVARPTDPITGDFEPDGTWYSMISARGALYAVESNHGEPDRITTGGEITRVIDISAWQGHVVPTVVAYPTAVALSSSPPTWRSDPMARCTFPTSVSVRRSVRH